MQGTALLFFVLLAVVLVLTYLAIRREWFAPGITAGVSVVVSIVLMMLTAFGQGNAVLQAIIVGIVVGGLFSGATIAVAWHFHRQELQQRYGDGGEDAAYDYDEQPDELV